MVYVNLSALSWLAGRPFAFLGKIDIRRNASSIRNYGQTYMGNQLRMEVFVVLQFRYVNDMIII